MSSDVTMADAEAETHNAGGGELLVWPWTGILATTTDDDDATADAASTLAFHAHQHFAGVPTTALQEATAGDGHHHHFLVLHFGKSWAGLRDAMSLPGRFPGAGRREWRRRRSSREGATSGAVYGWPAGEDDLRGGDGVVVGRFLREAGGAARSAEDVERDEGRGEARINDRRGLLTNDTNNRL